MELFVENLSVALDEAHIVKSASFSLRRGELVALLGPNGAGKTMLLRAALGLEKRAGGIARIGDEDVAELAPVERARRLSYLPQLRPLAWPNRVYDIVSLGRYAYGASPGRLAQEDETAVTEAIAACDITHLAQRKVDTLSGGELSRVHCARAFAASTPLIVADEPAAALDPRHQFRVMDLFRDFVDQDSGGGGGALVVLHDITLAARYADRIIWMSKGKIVAEGSPVETITPERLASIYGVKAKVDGVKVDIEGAL